VKAVISARHPFALVAAAFLVTASSVLAVTPTAFSKPAGVDALSPDDVAKAISSLKDEFVRPESLNDAGLARATLQGLLDRLSPGVDLVSGTAATVEPAIPFHSEIADGKTGYLLIGALTADSVGKARQILGDWSAYHLHAVIVDLRGTPATSDFQTASDLAGFFCAKGTELFCLTAGKGHVLTGSAAGGETNAQTHTFTSQAEPLYKGLVVVITDSNTAEAPEAIAAVLQKCAKALIVGDKTAGRAYAYSDVPLSGSVLRVAIAQVILPDGKEPGENGILPDINVSLDTAPGAHSKAEILHSISTRGIPSVTTEHDRPHLNEAALVSGSNPEIDEIKAEESGEKTAPPLLDHQLQRALDLVTSITIYEGKTEAP
jgi:hypothetical protein